MESSVVAELVATKKPRLEVDESSNGNNSVVTKSGDVSKSDDEKEKQNSTEETEEIKAFLHFDGFQLKRVLSNSADNKRVVIEATVTTTSSGTTDDSNSTDDNKQTAIVVLDKKPFTEEVLAGFFSSKSTLQHTFQNDIYGSYDCNPIVAASEIKATVVYPATKKHIDKYVWKPLYLIDETPDIYKKVTLPYLENSSFNIQWVFNILEHKKESERIVFEDSDPETGFILLPDLKWDGVATENLYLVAIVHKKGIRSIRELNGNHLPLLKNILNAGCKAIQEKYGLKRSELRIYLHYQPSYYHLHIHFTSLRFNAPGIYAEKSHLLQSVISNLESNPNYYEEATLPFVVKQDDKLHSD